MIPRLVFGMGTGRCGTYTLSRIFDAQEGWYGQHEGFPLPWERDPCVLWYEMIKGLVKVGEAETIAVSSFVWINYIGLIMGNFNNPKAICIERAKYKVVDSFIRHIPTLNHWTDPKSTSWNPNVDSNVNQSILWPKYDLSKRDAIARYWDEYHAKAEYLQRRYPGNFRIYNTEDVLNDPIEQSGMLAFAGVEAAQQRIFVGQKLNSLGSPKGNLMEEHNVHA